MPAVETTGFKHMPFGRLTYVGMIIWSLLVSFSLSWNMIQIEEQVEYLATEEARANWNKDLAFRRWATRHGGLYVKPNDRTPPNPYLAHLPRRDVVTTDGMKLTLMNPAYMMRQMTEEFEEMYGIKGSITGQILLNPINKADHWELDALKRFDQGETEVTEISKVDDKPYLRLMRPMIMRQGCVKCHGHLGFKVGDIRGGVSVSIPLSPYREAATQTAWTVAMTHGGIWLLGLAGISYIGYRSKRFEIERIKHEQAIKDIATGVSAATGEVFFQHLVKHMASIFNTSYAFIGELDKDNPEKVKSLAIFANGNIVDNIEYNLKGTPCFNVINNDTCAYSNNIQKLFPEDKLLREMNAESYIGRPLYNSTGKAMGILVVLDNKPLSNTTQVGELLEIFAARASAEMERLTAEKALRRSQKMEAIGQLSGGIAHDFNNQLGIIIGYLDFLEDFTVHDEKPNKWVKTASRATQRCIDLTRQLLSFSRTHTNKKIQVDINVQLQEQKMIFSRSVTPAINIEYDLSDDIWLTEIDPGEFQDATLNMVINARDAMPSGGKLLIETSNKHLDENSASLNPDAKAGDYVQIILSDTGCGMNKQIQERIFEPFYTTKSKGKGTGLGMSMVYGFVKRFDGFIQIYSELNVGTTLRIYLPRLKKEATHEENQYEKSTNEQNLPRGNETILIVDDEIDLLDLADNYLTDLGYQTYKAENAEQALKILNDNKIDLLFSDVVMPGGMNGYELAQQATELHPELNVLITSGFTSKTIAENGLARFAVNLLSKPHLKSELASRIRHILDKKPS